MVEEPLSPSDKLRKTPCPPSRMERATGAPMAKNASPGWAAIAMMFAGADDAASTFRGLGRPGMGLGFS
jgi:hypothetical protein